MDYINEQYDPAMNWKDAEYCIKKWNKPMALKGVMSVEDARRAIDIGCTAIMISIMEEDNLMDQDLHLIKLKQFQMLLVINWKLFLMVVLEEEHMFLKL